MSADGHVLVHPTEGSGRSHDLKELVDHLMRASDPSSRADPVPGHPPTRRRHRQRLQDRYYPASYQGRYICVYPIKGPSSASGREELLDFGREYGSAWRPGPSLSCWRRGAGLQRHAIICNASRTPIHRDGDAGPEKIAGTSSPWSRVHRARLILNTPRRSGSGRRSSCGSSSRARAADGGRDRAAIRSKFGLTVAESARVSETSCASLA